MTTTTLNESRIKSSSLLSRVIFGTSGYHNSHEFSCKDGLETWELLYAQWIRSIFLNSFPFTFFPVLPFHFFTFPFSCIILFLMLLTLLTTHHAQCTVINCLPLVMQVKQNSFPFSYSVGIGIKVKLMNNYGSVY